jgi:hypothetical protein
MIGSVMLEISKPLRKGTHIGSKADGIFWVDFKYEKLPQFCFYCGCVGHGEIGCVASKDDDEHIKSKKLGPWLRTNIGGRRVNDTVHDYHAKVAPKGVNKKVPVDIIDKLASMFVDGKSEGISEYTGLKNQKVAEVYKGEANTNENNKVIIANENISGVVEAVNTENDDARSYDTNFAVEEDSPRMEKVMKQKKWKRLKDKKQVESDGTEIQELIGKRKEHEEYEDMDISSPKRRMGNHTDLTAGLAKQASREQ